MRRISGVRAILSKQREQIDRRRQHHTRCRAWRRREGVSFGENAWVYNSDVTTFCRSVCRQVLLVCFFFKIPSAFSKSEWNLLFACAFRFGVFLKSRMSFPKSQSLFQNPKPLFQSLERLFQNPEYLFKILNLFSKISTRTSFSKSKTSLACRRLGWFANRRSTLSVPNHHE